MNIRSITKIAVFSAILSILGPINVPIGAVPITLTSFVIFILSALLLPHEATLAVLLYIVLGLIGIPVFSGYLAGISILAGPTGGYIIGFLVSSIIISFINKLHKSILKYLISFIIGTIVIYMFGMINLIFILKMNITSALITGVVPFIMPDILKIIFASVTVHILNKRFTNNY